MQNQLIIQAQEQKNRKIHTKSFVVSLIIIILIVLGYVISHYGTKNGDIVPVDQEANKLIFQHKNIVDQGQWVEISNIKDGNVHQIQLQYSNPGDYYKKINSTYIENVTLEVIRESQSEMTFRMSDVEQQLFRLPKQFPFPYTKDQYSQGNVQIDEYGYEMMENGVQLRVYKKDGNDKVDIFNTKDFKIIFSKLYTEIQTQSDTPYIWGLGDRRTMTYQLQSGNYTIWNKDQGHIDTGNPNGQNYGTHPMWLQRDINGNYHIIMICTSNPMQFEYKQQSFLNFKIVGGIVEIKFFFGGSDPREVIKKYHRYVNGWALHPFWASGWQQSRWGYKSSSELLEVVHNYTKYNLPLDVMWSDLDYMKDKKDFTLDQGNYTAQDLRKMTDLSQAEGVQWVPIIDPGIAIDSDCARTGLQNDIFIKSTKNFDTLANGTHNLVGCVWPGKVFYPDFNHPNSTDTWHQCFTNFNLKYNITPAGVWIDMNEYSNFVNGELDPGIQCPNDYESALIQNNNRSLTEIEVQDLPFNPQGDINIETHTVSISGIHYNEKDALYLRQVGINLTELNVHALNGFMEGIATRESQRRIHQTNLTFILSRSTFAGSGRFVQHWLGDNGSTWEWLSSSMAAIFSFNMYGTPFVGDDICGFSYDTTDQLCARWIQLGSLYPFSRSHDIINQRVQEPYTLDEYVLQSTRKSLNLRYTLMKFYYTEFVKQYDTQIQAGVGTIFNPLFYLYKDIQTLKIDRQFVIGDSIIVIPIVKEQLNLDTRYTTQEFYIPEGATWFEWFTGNVLVGPLNSTVTINFTDTSLVCLNQGKIIPISDVIVLSQLQKATNVYRSRYLPTSLGLAVALEAQQNGLSYRYSAQGTYLSLLSYEPQNVEKRCWNSLSTCHRKVTVTAQSDSTTLSLTFTNVAASQLDNSEAILINNLEVYGVVKQNKSLMKISIPVQFSSLQPIWRVEIKL